MKNIAAITSPVKFNPARAGGVAPLGQVTDGERPTALAGVSPEALGSRRIFSFFEVNDEEISLPLLPEGVFAADAAPGARGSSSTRNLLSSLPDGVLETGTNGKNSAATVGARGSESRGNLASPTGGVVGTVLRPEGLPVADVDGRENLACQYWNKAPQGIRTTVDQGPGEPSYIGACRSGSWSLNVWNTKTGEDRWLRFKCRSWRHEGPCQLWKGAQDFVRIRQALTENPGNWVYLVLTVDPADWTDIYHAYKGLYGAWDKLRKRISRSFGKIQYIALVERHRSGWPHINILVRNEQIATACAGDGWKTWRREWLNPVAVSCGFGLRVWAEPMRDEEAMAGYLVKLSGSQGDGTNSLASEIAKPLQVPTNAPKNFRRLRASRGLLPKPLKNPDLTGKLYFNSLEQIFTGDLVAIGTATGKINQVEKIEDSNDASGSSGRFDVGHNNRDREIGAVLSPNGLDCVERGRVASLGLASYQAPHVFDPDGSRGSMDLATWYGSGRSGINLVRIYPSIQSIGRDPDAGFRLPAVQGGVRGTRADVLFVRRVQPSDS